MITRATVLSRFNAIRANVLGGAEVTCTYHDEAFTGLRNGLQLDQVTQIYGGLDDYQFQFTSTGQTLRTVSRIMSKSLFPAGLTSAAKL